MPSLNTVFPPEQAPNVDTMTERGSLDSTFGSVLIGTFLGAVLYGFNLHQLYQYIRHYSNSDDRFIKILVLGAMALATVHVVLSFHTCYFYLVMNFGNGIILIHSEATWSVNLIPAVGSCITIASHIFFARRVSMISFKYGVISVASIILIIVEIGFGIALAIKGFLENSIEPYLRLNWLLAACFGSAVLAHVLLTGSLVTVLRRGRMNHNRPEAAFDVVMVYIVNTGMLNCIFDALTFLLVVTAHNVLYWAALNLVTTRLYTNTFLAVLNSRQRTLNHGTNIFEAGTVGMNVIARVNRRAEVERWDVPELPSGEPSIINIKVTTEVEGDVASRGEQSDCDRKTELGTAEM